MATGRPSRGNSVEKDDRPIVTVLGPGQMGLVCAGLLASPQPPTIPASADSGKMLCRPVRVRLWGHDEEETGKIAQTRRSSRLEGFRLPDEVEVVLKDDVAVNRSSLIVSAIPVQYIRDVWMRLAPHVPPEAGVLSVAKGIENLTMLRPTQIIADVLRQTGRDNPDGKPRRYACLSGPTIAAGIVDGLQAGNNAKSALLARGLAEITRLGIAMGAQHDTFFGIAGVGDLATTCFSPEGRNRSCGEALGRGQRLESYLKSIPYVVEGVATTKSLMMVARKYRVDMPITSAVHAILFEGVDPIEAIGQLMAREMKAEKVG